MPVQSFDITHCHAETSRIKPLELSHTDKEVEISRHMNFADSFHLRAGTASESNNAVDWQQGHVDTGCVMLLLPIARRQGLRRLFT